MDLFTHLTSPNLCHIVASQLLRHLAIKRFNDLAIALFFPQSLVLVRRSGSGGAAVASFAPKETNQSGPFLGFAFSRRSARAAPQPPALA